MNPAEHLVNDIDDYADPVEIIDEEISAPTADVVPNAAEVLGPLLNASLTDTYSFNESLKDDLTLRNCNKLYGDNGGCKYGGAQIPEFDRCVTKGCISPLRRFINIVGHFATGEQLRTEHTAATICLRPELFDTLDELALSLEAELAVSVRKGRLWSLANTNMCTCDENGDWMYEGLNLDSKLASSMSMLAASFDPPLSFHTHHAWLESAEFKDATKTMKIFKQPQETTAVPGFMGTVHNCQVVDLAQELDNDPADIPLREADLNGFYGFICLGHTAHSLEAGRVARVASKVYTRIFGQTTLDRLVKALQLANRKNSTGKEYILYCLGKMVICSLHSLITIRNFLASTASIDGQTATLEINTDFHVALLSISSGVLLRRDANRMIVSSNSILSSAWPDGKKIPEYPDPASPEGFEFYYSTYFQLIPFICYDRPPRPLIASVQHIQATATPYGAGTSSVAPTHTSKPLVSTPYLESILNDRSAGIPDHAPGEDLMVLVANFNDTYEDSIIFSKAGAARGLFNHMAYSANVVNSNEKIPDVGQKTHIKNNRWWKTYSASYLDDSKIKQAEMENDNGTLVMAEVDGRGKVVAKSVTASGQVSVKMLRHTASVNGDKGATGHGQKGVLKLWDEQDMPYGIDENGEVLRFDMIISMSSIANRLTEGQYYEMIAGARAVREGRRLIIAPGEYETEHTETVVYSGTTGELITRPDEDNVPGMEEWDGDIPILASWGICRVWAMTQLSFDKQHYTHNTSSKYTINTLTGRTAGGGIREGEMELHAGVSSGLIHCKKEIKSRVDLIRVQYCTRCQRVYGQTCICGDDATPVPWQLPHAMLVYDYANVIVNGQVIEYKVEL